MSPHKLGGDLGPRSRQSVLSLDTESPADSGKTTVKLTRPDAFPLRSPGHRRSPVTDGGTFASRRLTADEPQRPRNAHVANQRGCCGHARGTGTAFRFTPRPWSPGETERNEDAASPRCVGHDLFNPCLFLCVHDTRHPWSLGNPLPHSHPGAPLRTCPAGSCRLLEPLAVTGYGWGRTHTRVSPPPGRLGAGGGA